MTLAYGRDTSDAGAAAKDITITTTLGIAERLYQRLENYGNAGDGLITEEINRLSAQNLDTTDKIATLEARLVIYQNTLIEKYAAMEQIGRAHVRTPVTNAHLVCRLLLEKKKNKTKHTKNHSNINYNKNT